MTRDRTTNSVSQILRKIEYLGKKGDGAGCGLPWSNRSEPDDGLKIFLAWALRVFIARDDSAIAPSFFPCFARFVVDRIPTPMLEECIKAFRQEEINREWISLRALLELYQEMPLTMPTKESNRNESYRRLEEKRRYSNRELKMNQELIERARDSKDYVTLGKLKSFQYVSDMPNLAYNHFMDEEARDTYFDFKQVIVLDLWVERVKQIGMLTFEQPRLGVILEERVVELSVPKLKRQVSFDCDSWDGPLKTSLVTIWELLKPSWALTQTPV